VVFWSTIKCLIKLRFTRQVCVCICKIGINRKCKMHWSINSQMLLAITFCFVFPVCSRVHTVVVMAANFWANLHRLVVTFFIDLKKKLRLAPLQSIVFFTSLKKEKTRKLIIRVTSLKPTPSLLLRCDHCSLFLLCCFCFFFWRYGGNFTVYNYYIWCVPESQTHSVEQCGMNLFELASSVSILCQRLKKRHIY